MLRNGLTVEALHERSSVPARPPTREFLCDPIFPVIALPCTAAGPDRTAMRQLM